MDYIHDIVCWIKEQCPWIQYRIATLLRETQITFSDITFHAMFPFSFPFHWYFPLSSNQCLSDMYVSRVLAKIWEFSTIPAIPPNLRQFRHFYGRYRVCWNCRSIAKNAWIVENFHILDMYVWVTAGLRQVIIVEIWSLCIVAIPFIYNKDRLCPFFSNFHTQTPSQRI